MDVSALRLYLMTSSYVNHANVDDERSWRHLEHMLPYLKQMLSCLVCGNLLCQPCKSRVSSQCLHYVCRGCIGGRMMIRPSCSWCKDYSQFTEDRQVRLLVVNFKTLCQFVQTTNIYSCLKTQQLDNPTATPLSDIIDEGACFTDTTSEDEDSTAIAETVEKEETVKSLLSAHCANYRGKRSRFNSSASSCGVCDSGKTRVSLPNISDALVALTDTMLPNSSASASATATAGHNKVTPHRISGQMLALNYFERAKNMWNEMNESSSTNSSGVVTPNPLQLSVNTSAGSKSSPANGIATSRALHFPAKMKSTVYASMGKKKLQAGRLAAQPATLGCLSISPTTSPTISPDTVSVLSNQASPVQYSVVSNTNHTMGSGTVGNTAIPDDDSRNKLKLMLKRTFKKATAAANNLCKLDGDNVLTSLQGEVPPAVVRGKGRGKARERALSGGTVPGSRRGCRCGTATASPGKLTCCGQRCPCYIDKRGCRRMDCRCRGCRNTFGLNTTTTTAAQHAKHTTATSPPYTNATAGILATTTGASPADSVTAPLVASSTPAVPVTTPYSTSGMPLQPLSSPRPVEQLITC